MVESMLGHLTDQDISPVVVCRKMAPKGKDAIKKCGLVGVGMVFLEEVCHCGDRF